MSLSSPITLSSKTLRQARNRIKTMKYVYRFFFAVTAEPVLFFIRVLAVLLLYLELFSFNA